jgi:uncharacterized LabA/DUF88 family protein
MVSLLLSAYVFIDGNNLYHNLRASDFNPSSLDLLKLSEYVCDHYSCHAKRTYYYNSVPSIEMGKEKYFKHRDFIEEVKRLPGFEVKTRKLQRQSNHRKIEERMDRVAAVGFCEDCKSISETECRDCIGEFSMKEKGIDVQIAIDMMHLCAVEGSCDYCLLISGDADFLPALDIIGSKGKGVGTASVYHGYSTALREGHDYFCMDLDHLRENCARTKK